MNLHRPLDQRLSQRPSDKTIILNEFGTTTQKSDACDAESRLDHGDSNQVNKQIEQPNNLQATKAGALS